MFSLYNFIIRNSSNYNDKIVIRFLNNIYEKELNYCLVDITYDFFNFNVSIEKSDILFQMEKILLPRFINENILKIIYENKINNIIIDDILRIYNLYSINDYLDDSFFKSNTFKSFCSVICCYYPCLISNQITNKVKNNNNLSFPQLMIKRSQIKNCLNIYNNFNKPYNFDYKTTFYFLNLLITMII